MKIAGEQAEARKNAIVAPLGKLGAPTWRRRFYRSLSSPWERFVYETYCELELRNKRKRGGGEELLNRKPSISGVKSLQKNAPSNFNPQRPAPKTRLKRRRKDEEGRGGKRRPITRLPTAQRGCKTMKGM